MKGRADSGKEEHFRIELGGRKALETKGWARRTVKAGDIVTVDGWYGRDNHAHINAKTVHVNHDKRDFDAASSYFSTAAAGN